MERFGYKYTFSKRRQPTYQIDLPVSIWQLWKAGRLDRALLGCFHETYFEIQVSERAREVGRERESKVEGLTRVLISLYSNTTYVRRLKEANCNSMYS